MDGLRVARSQIGVCDGWSGAGMYPAYQCGVSMPLALMKSADRTPDTSPRSLALLPRAGLSDLGLTVRHHTISTSPFSVPASNRLN
jgi:hypothetical protein